MSYSIRGHCNSILYYGHLNNYSISYSSDPILLAICAHSEPYIPKYPSTLHTSGRRYQVERLGTSPLSSQLVSYFCNWNLGVPKVAQSLTKRFSETCESYWYHLSITSIILILYLPHHWHNNILWEPPNQHWQG